VIKQIPSNTTILSIFRKNLTMRTLNKRFHALTRVACCTALTTLIGFAQTNNEPDEYLSLRQNWQKARKQATDPVDSKYLAALQKLKTRYATSDRLEDAIIVDKEIKRIEKEIEPATEKSQSLLAEIEGTEWRHVRGDVNIHFKDKKLFWGSAKIKSSMAGWEFVEEKKSELSFKYKNGFIAVLKFSEDRQSFVSSDGDRTFTKITE
jgi:hypothetical protein